MRFRSPRGATLYVVYMNVSLEPNASFNKKAYHDTDDATMLKGLLEGRRIEVHGT